MNYYSRFLIFFFTFTALLQGDGFIDIDTRWIHPQYVNFRPANAQEASVNPPRFSWGYKPNITVPYTQRSIPKSTFHFEISSDPTFQDPEITIDTPYNFYNSMKPLAAGHWHWRVGYDLGTEREQWSLPRSFVITENTPVWDRSFIHEAHAKLEAMSYPRMGPPNGDWTKWLETIKESSNQKRLLDQVIQRANKAIKKDWWTNFPENDLLAKPTNKRKLLTPFIYIMQDITFSCFAWKLTGDDKYLPAKEHLLKLAAFPIGGLSSPESNGGRVKFTSEITENMAFCYDWLYHDLAEEERKILRDSLEWRLKTQFYDSINWAKKESMMSHGFSVLIGSHSYQNMMWSIAPTLLMAGEFEGTEDMVEFILQALTSITGGAGPDEGWNEGPHYGNEKPATMLNGSLYATHLLPEMELQKNPFLKAYAKWHEHIAPIGIQRMPWGDIGAGDMSYWHHIRTGQMANMYNMTFISEDPWYDYRYNQIKDYHGKHRDNLRNHPWLHLLQLEKKSQATQNTEKLEKGKKNALFRESGWATFNSHQPSDFDKYNESIGMIMQARPRGGYSHSYKSDLSFVWHAYGKVLTSGGGTMLKMNPHTQDSISHNVILINGESQTYDHFDSKTPFINRPLYYKEHDKYIHFVADGTNSFANYPDLEYWLRHVIFFNEKTFIIYDDLKMKDHADPVIFSWLYHVEENVPLNKDKDALSFNYQLDDVRANVTIANDTDDLAFINSKNRDGLINPFTQKDYYPEIVKFITQFAVRMGRKYDQKTVDEFLTTHNIWINSKEKVHQQHFLAVLNASKADKPTVAIDKVDSNTVMIKENQSTTSLSFIDSTADIYIPLEKFREYAVKTNIRELPNTVLEETEDTKWSEIIDFENPDWMNTWALEGNTKVLNKGDSLQIDSVNASGVLSYRKDLDTNAVADLELQLHKSSHLSEFGLVFQLQQSDGEFNRLNRSGKLNEYSDGASYSLVFSATEYDHWDVSLIRNPRQRPLASAYVKAKTLEDIFNLQLSKKNGVLTCYINEEQLLSAIDPIPLPPGKIGLYTKDLKLSVNTVKLGTPKLEESQLIGDKDDQSLLENIGLHFTADKSKKWKNKIIIGKQSVSSKKLVFHLKNGGTVYYLNENLKTKSLSEVADELRSLGYDFNPHTSIHKTRLEPLSLAGEWKYKITKKMEPSTKPIPDPGITEDAKKAIEDTLDSPEWDTTTLPSSMDDIGLKQQDGEVVYYKEIKLPKNWEGRNATLNLGAIDDFDTVYFNGIPVGSTDNTTPAHWAFPRQYLIPSNLIQEGKNILSIRVIDIFGGGGFSGTAKEMNLIPNL